MRELVVALETLAVVKPRWGYRRLHWLLLREGWAVNHKRVQRVYRNAKGTVIDYGIVWYRADRYRFTVELSRTPVSSLER